MRLNNKVSLIVPTRKGHEAIDEKEVKFYVETVLKEFAYIAGGSSVIKQKGAWISDSDGLVIENNYLVYAHCTEDDLKDLTSVTRILSTEIEEVMEQDSVMYEVNGEAMFS